MNVAFPVNSRPTCSWKHTTLPVLQEQTRLSILSGWGKVCFPPAFLAETCYTAVTRAVLVGPAPSKLSLLLTQAETANCNKQMT